MSDRERRLWGIVGTALLIYVTIALTRYRFAHPDLTETELFLRIPDALFWR